MGLRSSLGFSGFCLLFFVYFLAISDRCANSVFPLTFFYSCQIIYGEMGNLRFQFGNTGISIQMESRPDLLASRQSSLEAVIENTLPVSLRKGRAFQTEVLLRLDLPCGSSRLPNLNGGQSLFPEALFRFLILSEIQLCTNDCWGHLAPCVVIDLWVPLPMHHQQQSSSPSVYVPQVSTSSIHKLSQTCLSTRFKPRCALIASRAQNLIRTPALQCRW